MEKSTFGIIGLGKMGGNMALLAADRGYKVIGYDRTPTPEQLHCEAFTVAQSLEQLTELLPSPKIVFIYIPAGSAVDAVLELLAERLQEGDIVVDGGNSYWGDSIVRADRLKKRGIYLVDCGTSGGVSGARNGACFMAGGEPSAMDRVAPILRDLAVPNGFSHTGGPGSGHFVKLVHNGIEFGMLQAIGEGMDLLARYREELNIPDILKTWNNGSVIRSWLIELMHDVYEQKGGYDQVPAYIEDTGEVNWLVNDAMRMEVAIPVIAQSVMQLFSSRDSEKRWAKAIAMMRHGFGGHPFGPHEGIKFERQYGKIENAESSFLYKDNGSK